jgi:tetratricopeptide (TPR) repeat protein
MEEWLDFPDVIERVQEYLDIGLYSDARGLLDKYMDMYKAEWEMHFLYSRAWSEDNEPEKAIDCLTTGLRLERNNLDCLLGLFYAYVQVDQVRKGARFLLRAEKNHPGHELVLNALIWYYTDQSDFERAIGYYEQHRDFLADNPEVLRNVGIAYERSGNLDTARDCFARALELNPFFDEVRDLLADHFMIRGETEKSVALYRTHLKESANNIRTLSRLVFCLSQNSQLEEAEKVAHHTMSLYPNSPVGYVDLAYTHLNSGNADAALAAAAQALDVSPIDAEAMRVRAIAFSEKDMHAEAEKAFEAALSMAPDNPEIMRDYYHHLRDAGKYDKMVDAVHAVIDQERPYCMEDYWFLADYYQEEGQPVRAFHFLHKAYNSMPGENELIPPMIDIMLDKGHIRYSLPFLKRYVESKGWNEVMGAFARHKRLRGKWSQEGMRFLRFYGEKAHDFRSFVFMLYIRKFAVLAALFLAPLLAAGALFFVKPPLVIASSGSGLLAFFAGKKALQLLRKPRQGAVEAGGFRRT